MGEIADAIRRARNLGIGSRDSERGRASSRSSLAPATPLSMSDQPATPEHRVEKVESDYPAVVLDEGPNAEACRHLALRLRSIMEERGVRSVLVVSAERGDGKTTVACNLAIALGSLTRGRDIALVDLDLRKPSIASYLSLSGDAGIEAVLLGRAALDQVRVAVQSPAIDVFPALVPQRAAHELLVRPQLAELIGLLERRYSTVIIDTPPAPVVPDANLILRHVGACVPVVRTGKTRARSFRRLVETLPRSQMIGWVLNCDRSSSNGDYEYYYYGADAGRGVEARRSGAR
jgi:non-specific protein-tyrosine kinase